MSWPLREALLHEEFAARKEFSDRADAQPALHRVPHVEWPDDRCDHSPHRVEHEIDHRVVESRETGGALRGPTEGGVDGVLADLPDRTEPECDEQDCDPIEPPMKPGR